MSGATKRQPPIETIMRPHRGASGEIEWFSTPLCDCWPVCFNRPITLCRVDAGFPLEAPEVLLPGDRDLIESDWTAPACGRGGYGRHGESERHDRRRRRLVAALEVGGGLALACLVGSWLLSI